MTTESDTAMAEFLAKGGVIQQGEYRKSGRVEGAPVNPWGAGKKTGRPPKTDVPPEEDFGVEE